MAQRGLSIVIGGQVAGSLLSGLAALRDQLRKLSSEASQAGKSQVSGKLGAMADKLQSATDKVKNSTEITGDAIREMFSEVSSAADKFSGDMQRAGKEGAEGLSELSSVDLNTKNQIEAVRSLTEALSRLNDDDLKKGSKVAKEFEKTMKGLGSSFVETKDDTESYKDSIQALVDQWRRWSEGLTDPEGIRSAQKAMKELADAIYGTERALRDSGQEMEGWVDSLDADKLQQAFQKGLIEPTKRGFKIHSEKASEFINLTKEQIDAVNKYTNAMTDLDKELRDVGNWDKQTKAQKNYAQALQHLTETRGRDSKEVKHWLSTLRDSESALSRYKSQFDETETEMRDTIDTVDRLSLVQKSLSGDIKVTKKGIQVLTADGLEPFKEMTVEAADKLGLLSTKLKKDFEGKTSIEFEAFKPETIKDVQWLASSVKEVSKETSVYKNRLAELREEENKGVKGAKEMRQAWEQLASQYEDNNKAADQVWKNLNKIENTIHSQVSALDKQDKAYEEVFRSMDRVAAYQKIFGKTDDLKIMNKRFQALNESGLKPFNRLTEESADKLGVLHTRYKRNIQDTREQADAYDEWTQSIKKVSGQNQAHAEALEKLGHLYGKDSDSVHRYNSAVLQAYRNVNKYIDTKKTHAAVIRQEIERREKAGKNTDRYRKKLDKLNREIDEAKKKQSLVNETTQVWNERVGLASKGSSDFAYANKRLRQETSMLGSAMGHVGKRVKQFAAFMAAALIVRQVTIAIRELIRAISDYDQVLYNLQAIVEITIDQARLLGDTIRDVARDTKFSAAEVGDGVRLLGQAGFDMVKSMQALQGVARLATGTMEKFGSVVELVTTTINAFQMQTIRTSEAADIFANAINASKLNIDKLNTAFNYVGAAGKQAGLTLNELVGTLMTLADNGIRASTMGTGLRRMLLKMISPSTDLREELSAVGMTIEDINPKFVGYEKSLQNLAPLLWDFERQTVNMGKAVDYFGTRAAQVAAVLLRETSEGGAITRAIEKTRELGSAARMSALQQEGLELKLKNLVDRAKNVAIALGEAGLTGIIKGVVDALRGLAAAAEGVLSTEFASWAVPIAALSTAMFTLNASFVGLATVIQRYKLIQKLMDMKGLLIGWPGYVAAAVGVLGVFIYKVETYYSRAADAAGKASEELIKSADSMKAYGEVLASASREGSEAFSDAVYYIEQDASDIADKLANELGYESMTAMAAGFEKGSVKAQEAIAVLRGETNKSLTEMAAKFGQFGEGAEESITSIEKKTKDLSISARLAARTYAQAGDKMVESILNIDRHIDKLRARHAGGANRGIGNILTTMPEDEIKKEEVVQSERIERLTYIALEQAHLKGKESVEEFNKFIREQYSKKFKGHADLLEKFVERATKAFKHMNSEAGVSIEELHKVVETNAKEIRELMKKLSPEQEYEFAGAMNNIKKQVEQFKEWLEDNTDYSQTKIKKLVNDFKTDLKKQELHGILGMESTDFEEDLAKLEAHFEARKAKAEKDSQEMIDLRRGELRAKLKMYQDELSNMEEYNASKEREYTRVIGEIKKELKGLADEELEVYSDVVDEAISNIEYTYKLRKSKAEENTKRMHKLNKEEAEKKLEFYEWALDLIDDKESETYRNLKSKAIDLQNELKNLTKAQRDFVFEGMSQEIDNIYDRRLQKVKENSVAELEIEKQRINELLELERERKEAATTDRERGEIESNIIAMENQLTQNQIELLDKKAEKVESASERSLKAAELELAAFETNIEKQKLYGEISESQGMIAVSKKELELAEKKRESHREDMQEYEKIYGSMVEDIEAYKEAKIEEKELDQEVNEKKLEHLQTQIDAADTLFNKEKDLAEARHNLALAGLEEDKERFKITESDRKDVLGYLERESQMVYGNAQKKLAAEKQLFRETKDAYSSFFDELEKILGEEKAKETEIWKMAEMQKREYVKRTQMEIMQLQVKTEEARIRAQGSLPEKLDLGIKKYSEDVKEQSKDIVDNTQDMAKLIHDSGTDAFSSWITGSAKAKDAFKDFARSVVDEMGEMLAKSVTKKFVGFFANLIGTGLESILGGGTSSTGMTGPINPAMTTRTSHAGGVIGEEITSLRTVSTAIFDGAKRLHNGISGLANNEYPAILQKGEVVFTQGQLSALADVFKSAMQNETRKKDKDTSPNVEVNVINKTSEKVDAQQSEPRFQEDKWVLNVVLDAANRNRNNFGKNLKGSLSKA